MTDLQLATGLIDHIDTRVSAKEEMKAHTARNARKGVWHSQVHTGVVRRDHIDVVVPLD